MVKGRAGKFISFLILILLVALAVSVLVKARRAEPSAEVRPEVGFAAPPLMYKDENDKQQPIVDLNGKPVRLEDYRDKAVFINFWATWCPPCKREMPDIQLIQKRYGDKVKVLAINATDQDDEPAVRDFVQRYKLAFDVPLDRTGDVVAVYEVYYFPTSIFINKKGIITDRFEGAISEGMMESAVRKALQED